MNMSEKRFHLKRLANTVDRTYAMQTWSGSEFVNTLLMKQILVLQDDGFDLTRDAHIVYVSRELHRWGCNWDTIRECVGNNVLMSTVLKFLEGRLSSHVVTRDFLANRLKQARLGRDLLPCDALGEVAA